MTADWHRIDDPENPPPIGVTVELGWWDSYGGKRLWLTGFCTLKRTWFRKRIVSADYGFHRATHWRHAPPPPVTP